MKQSAYRRNLAEGKCGHCGRPNSNGHADCDSCLAKRRAYMETRYRQMQAERRCGHCSRPLPESYYFVLCEVCRTKQNERLRKRWREKHGQDN